MPEIVFYNEMPKLQHRGLGGRGNPNKDTEAIRAAMRALKPDGPCSISVKCVDSKQAKNFAHATYTKKGLYGYVEPPDGYKFRSSYYKRDDGSYTLYIYIEKVGQCQK